jgi:protein phosphatase
MEFDLFVITDPGRVRDNNEDAVSCDSLRGLAVLADGMGGYNAGEIASAMAVTFIRTEMSRWLQEVGVNAAPQSVRHAMEVCVGNANLAIFNAAHANPQFSGILDAIVGEQAN